MIRDVDLISHLPPFLQRYREIKFITDTENPEFQFAADESERIKDNQFILSADEEGIKKFEKLLNINASKDERLNTRRSRVMSRWNDISPYTYHALVSKLQSLHDSDNFIVNRYYNDYEIEIITHLEIAGQVDELDRILDYIMPVHLVVDSKNRIYCHAEGQTHIANGMAHCSIIEFSDGYEETFNVEGEYEVGMGHSHASIHEVTDSYEERYQTDGRTYMGSTIIGTAEVMMTDAYDENVQIDGDATSRNNTSIAQIIEVSD